MSTKTVHLRFSVEDQPASRHEIVNIAFEAKVHLVREIDEALWECEVRDEEERSADDWLDALYGGITTNTGYVVTDLPRE